MMNELCEGVHSDSVRVESGVPQGTVLGQLMLLCHIHELPDCVKVSNGAKIRNRYNQVQVCLLADDWLLYRTIKNQKRSRDFTEPFK